MKMINFPNCDVSHWFCKITRFFATEPGRPTHRPEPLKFKEWLLQGMEHYKKQGFSFELVTPSLMRIKRPGQNSVLRTHKNFLYEYENEYLSNF
jgi:hypothetical protein